MKDLRRRVAMLGLATAFGALGAAIAGFLTRHSASDLRRVAPFAGATIAWAVLGFVGFAIRVSRERDALGIDLGTSDWRVINEETVRAAELASSKAWLIGVYVGLGVTGELMLLSRSLLWLIATPFLCVGAWLFSRRSLKGVKEMVEPMDEPTRRFWNRTRSP